MGSIGRLFVAVTPPAETRDLLAAVLADVFGKEGPPGKVAPPDNWHLTLRFLGPTDEVTYERLLAELDAADLGGTFGMELGELGAFPNARHATVLWVGVTAGAGHLGDLAAVVEASVQGVGFEQEGRPYRPHLTLSRIRPDQDVRGLVDDGVFDAIPFPVDELVVYRSHLGAGPATYEALERFPL